MTTTCPDCGHCGPEQPGDHECPSTTPEPRRAPMSETCMICGKPATTVDGIVDANLCDDPACLAGAWDKAYPAHDDRAEVYPSGDEWRWRLRAANGQVIAGPQEGYVDKAHAHEMAERVTGRKAVDVDG